MARPPLLKAPAALRDTVLLFGQLGPEESVAGLFGRVDWTGVTRRQLIHAFLDRPPATAAEASDGAAFNASAAALELFASDAFRNDIALRLLRSFPGKRRVLFVHIPKAAGTDFMAAMRGVLPHVGNELGVKELVPDDRLALRLRRLARGVKGSDTIFMGGGHIPLSWYLDEKLYRFNDRLIAIVRHPREMCVSLANYIANGLKSDPALSRSDTRGWARALGLSTDDIATMDARLLALAVVAHPKTQLVNPICSLLGDGMAPAALDNLARACVEITSTEYYDRWLLERWNIVRKLHVNASPRLIGWDDLHPWQQARIEAGCQQDYIVYDAVTQCLARSGASSVTGPEVARFAREGKASASF
jgi:hypothetical protein